MVFKLSKCPLTDASLSDGLNHMTTNFFFGSFDFETKFKKTLLKKHTTSVEHIQYHQLSRDGPADAILNFLFRAYQEPPAPPPPDRPPPQPVPLPPEVPPEKSWYLVGTLELSEMMGIS